MHKAAPVVCKHNHMLRQKPRATSPSTTHPPRIRSPFHLPPPDWPNRHPPKGTPQPLRKAPKSPPTHHPTLTPLHQNGGQQQPAEMWSHRWLTRSGGPSCSDLRLQTTRFPRFVHAKHVHGNCTDVIHTVNRRSRIDFHTIFRIFSSSTRFFTHSRSHHSLSQCERNSSVDKSQTLSAQSFPRNSVMARSECLAIRARRSDATKCGGCGCLKLQI